MKISFIGTINLKRCFQKCVLILIRRTLWLNESYERSRESYDFQQFVKRRIYKTKQFLVWSDIVL